MEKIRETIDLANLKFGEFVRKGDTKSLASLYTKDACLLPTSSGIVKGRKAIEEFWGGVIAGMGLKEIELKTVEVIGEGDAATEMGEYMLKLEPRGQKPAVDKGKYIVLWKKTPEGWKLHWDIWNTSLRPP